MLGLRLGLGLNVTPRGTPTPTPTPAEIYGSNLSGIVYYGGSRSFANLARYSGWNASLGATPIVDEHGNLTDVDEGAGTNHSAFKSTFPCPTPGVEYIARWQGAARNGVECTVTMSDGTGYVNADHSITFTPNYSNPEARTGGGVFGVTLKSPYTDYPLNPVTDIDIREVSLDPEVTFHPDFISWVSDNFTTVRLMDWQGTTLNTGVQTWADRFLPTDLPGGGKKDGVAVEHIAELATLTGCNIWVCIPFFAEDLWITNFFTYLRDNTPAGCKIFVELHNETWNSGTFPTIYNAVIAYANDNGYSSGTAHDQNKWGHRHRHQAVMALVDAVFASDMSKVCRVLSGQVGNLSGSTLTGTFGSSDFDAIASAPYFGDTAATSPSSTTDPDTILSRLGVQIDTAIGRAVTDATHAASLGKLYLTYEMGQHIEMLTADFANFNIVQRSEEMGFYCGQYLAEFRRRVDPLISEPMLSMWFTDISKNSSSPKCLAFNLKETMWHTEAESYKLLAFQAAKEETFPAYILGSTPLVIDGEGTQYVGSTLTSTLPTFYNAVSASVTWTLDGVDIVGSTEAVISGQEIQFIATEDHIGGELSYRLDLVSPGHFPDANYAPASGVTVEPVTYFYALASGSSMTVPADMGATCIVHCIGPGGRGISSTPGGDFHGGGGGGAYAAKTMSLTPGATVNYQIGQAGGTLTDTWFDTSATVLAKAGDNAANAASSGGAGGSSASSIGDVKSAGGNGAGVGGGFYDGGGGGGAGGPEGNGGNGSSPSSSASAGGGGGANGGSDGGATAATGAGFSGGASRLGTPGGAGGSSTAPAGNGVDGSGGGGGGDTVNINGGHGSTEPRWEITHGPLAGQTVGPGSGGGGHGASGGLGGNGGNYGGGAGGARSATAATPGQGLIVIEYVPAS